MQPLVTAADLPRLFSLTEDDGPLQPASAAAPAKTGSALIAQLEKAKEGGSLTHTVACMQICVLLMKLLYTCM